VSVSLASLAVLGMCNSVVHWYQPTGHLDIDAVAEQFADLAVRSMLSGRAESLTGPHTNSAGPLGSSLGGSTISKTVSP
jgi:hypothetical protein